MLKVIYIMFTYGENYEGNQVSSNCEDAVHICFLLSKNIRRVKNDLRSADVCALLSMLMKVKSRLSGESNVAFNAMPILFF